MLDRTLALLRHGYGFLLTESPSGECFQTRLLGRRAMCLRGPEAAAFFYSDSFRRSDAIPGRIKKTLFGVGGVQGLDGSEHRVRKALFTDLTHPSHLAGLREDATQQWSEALTRWSEHREISVLPAAAETLTLSAASWLGLALRDEEATPVSRWMLDRVDGFAAIGPRHWRARRARRLSEAWAMAHIEQTRARGRNPDAPSTPLERVAMHRDVYGQPLPAHIAAVELLNLLRPTVAIAWYVAFAAHALAVYPERAEVVRGDERAAYEFAQEVRRTYPFTPFVGARATRDVQWKGQRIHEGQLVLLDIYGALHSHRWFEQAARFEPERFERPINEVHAFIPQGGGDVAIGHRCPGEDVTLIHLTAAARALAGARYQLAPDALHIPLHRIPATPNRGLVIEELTIAAPANTQPNEKEAPWTAQTM